jgi:hypothetical protein
MIIYKTGVLQKMTKGIMIKKIEKITKQNTTVYDFEVEDAHHYILEDGTISHNSYIPMKKMGGGSGLEYAASTIIFLSKKKDKDDKTKEVTGAIIKAVLKKARLTIENKEVETLLNYSDGLDPYYGLLTLTEKFGIAKKISNKYEFPDGNKAFESQIIKNPEKFFTKDILDSIDECCKNEFLYGKTNVLVGDETEE